MIRGCRKLDEKLHSKFELGTKCHSVEEAKENEMRWACGTYGGEGNTRMILVGKPERRIPLGRTRFEISTKCHSGEEMKMRWAGHVERMRGGKYTNGFGGQT